MVMQRSCSSLRVSVKRVSPALAPAMIPAFDTKESVKVDLPWSTWAMTDMLRMFRFLSIIPRISSTVKFTYKRAKNKKINKHHSHTIHRVGFAFVLLNLLCRSTILFVYGALNNRKMENVRRRSSSTTTTFSFHLLFNVSEHFSFTWCIELLLSGCNQTIFFCSW